MTPDEHKALDAVADRLGNLYQLIGRIQHENSIEGEDVTTALDETVALTHEVERISDRVQRNSNEEWYDGELTQSPVS